MRTLLPLWLLLALALPAAAAGPASPSSPWEGPAFSAPPAVLARAAAALPLPEPRDADVEVLLKEGRFEELAHGGWRTTTRRVFRVLTEVGVRTWGETRASWSPWRQQRPVLRVRVVSPAGEERWLDEKTLHEAPVEDGAPNVYSDERSLRAPLPALRVGSVVEEEVVVEDTRPFFDAGVLSHFYFASPVPVRRVRMLLDTAPTTALTVRVVGLPLDPVPQHQGERKRLVFEGGPYAPVPALEADVPPEKAFYPHVAFSTGRSWAEVAQAYHRLVEERLAGGPLPAQARQRVKGLKDRHAIAQRLLEWVQEQVRYTGLEFGAAAVVPAPPRETLGRAFGDCKDLSTLLVGLLREAGLPAHVALVRSGPEDVPELPGMGFFNHAIVHVPGTPALWLDPTDPGAEAGVVPAELQGRHALVAAASTQGLTRVDEAPAGEDAAVTTRTVFLAEEGPARVTEVRELTGTLASEYRRLLGAVRPADFRRNLESAAAAQYEGTLASLEHTPLSQRTGAFRLEMRVEGARFAPTGWRQARVPLRIDSPLSWLPASLRDVSDLLPDELGRRAAPAERQGELQLPRAYRAEVRYRLRPPPGFAVQAPPSDEVVALGPARLSLRFRKERDGGLSADFAFDAVKRRYSAAEVKAFRTALAALVRRPPVVAELEDRGWRLVEGGDARAGLEVYAAARGKGPARARYASALLALGFGEQARLEARRAVDEAPRSPLVHHVQAYVLQHDTWGRPRAPGADLAGAVAACRRALALEPGDEATQRLLAELLELNAEGERFGRGAPLGDAVAEWGRLREEVGTRDVQERHLLALYRSGAVEQALAAARAAPSSPLRDQVLVMALAEVKGAEAAAAEARTLESPQARRAALALAGDRLLTRRRYADAARLLEEALRGTYEPDLQTRLELVRRVAQPRETPAKEKAPVELVRRVVSAVWTARTAKDFDAQVRPLLSSRDRPDSVLRKRLKAMHQYAQRYAKRADLDAEGLTSMAEVAAAALAPKVEGKEGVGFRVTLQIPVGARTSEDIWYVVREGKEYRLLATETDPRPLGAEALRWLDGNRLQESITWIVWGVGASRGVSQEELGPLSSFARTLRGFTGVAPVHELRSAAAYLGAGTGDARVLATLQKLVVNTSTEERPRLQLALALAHRAAGNEGLATYWADEVYREHAREPEVFQLKQELLEATGRWEHLQRLADTRLELLDNDVPGLRARLEAAVALADWGEADEAARLLLATGVVDAESSKLLAWMALRRGKGAEAALAHAQRAVTLSEGEDAEALGILAALLVETGKLEEARALADQVMEQGEEGHAEPGGLYVRARLAEAYGLSAEARTLARAIPAAAPSRVRSFARLVSARAGRSADAGMP